MTDHSLLDDFIVESGEHLEETERNLLRLEQQPDDAVVLNDIFRSIHTIKGSSEYLGLERIAELTHKLESFLDLLRRGERVLDSRGIDLLIGANDLISQLVDDLARHRCERMPIEDMLARIHGFTGQAEPISAEAAIGETSESDCEAFTDEYDEELFGIFVSQLADGLESLGKESRNLRSASASEVEHVLKRYEDRLGTLQSSANYMGYDKLRQVYVQWSGAVTGTMERLFTAQEVDWEVFTNDVTAHYIRRIKGLFPKVAALQALERDEPSALAMDLPPSPPLHASEDSRPPNFSDVALSSEAPASGQDTMPGIELELFSESEDAVLDLPIKADRALFDDFIVEAGEQLEQTERNLLRLEQQPDDPMVLNEIFRSIHTIKGSSDYLGLERIAELTHKLESFLDLLRRGDRALDGQGFELLIGAHDRICQLVDDLARHGSERATIDDLVARISDCAVHSEPITDTAAPGEPATQGHSETLDEEYDEELFGIFASQLNEGLETICQQTRSLLFDGNPETVLDQYADQVNTLRSSANYMGYDKLKQLYIQWSEAVGEAGERLSAGRTFDRNAFARDVTDHFIGRVKGVFPNLTALQSLERVVPVQEALPVPEPTLLPEQADVGQQAEVAQQADPSTQTAAVEQAATPAPVDPELQQDFILEAREHLEEIEHNLRRLTQVPEDRDLLNELFRSMHTIKGSSEYLGLARTAELSHKLENLLDLLRCGQCMLSSTTVDLLMVCSDRIGMLVNDLATLEQEQTTIDDLVADIDAIVNTTPDQGALAPQASESEASPAVPELPVLQSVLTEADMPQASATPERVDAGGVTGIDVVGVTLARETALPEASPPETSERGPAVEAPETAVPEIAVTVYHEPYDSKLYAIFLAQFKEGLAQLAMEIGQLETQASSIESVTQRCRQWLARMRFSANYMEYDALKAVYDRWIQAADKLCDQLPKHDEVVWIWMYRQMMQAHMDMVRRYFALADLADALPAQEAEAPVVLNDATDGDPALEDEHCGVDDTGAMQPSIEATGIEAATLDHGQSAMSPQAPSMLEEQGLFSRLEMAFDERLGVDEDGDSLSHEQMAESLFSDDQARDEPPAAIGEPSTEEAGRRVREGVGIESLLLSALSGERVTRPPVVATPLARIPDTPAFADAAMAMEEDDQRTSYTPGRRRGDKFHERMVKQSIRVDAAKIDILMNQVGELVVNRAGFNQLFSDMRDFQLLLKQTRKFNSQEMKIVKDLTNRINEATVSLGRVTSELQENVMKVRMLPIAQLFSRYPRVVHDLVRNSEKKVELVIRGEETELDRMVIEQIADPLVHIIRNAVDHGIEALEERQRKGKPESGTLRLEAYHEGNYVVIEISDDGRGIDPDMIKARALSKGFFTAEELDDMSEDQVHAIIMRPGFSTVDEVTHTSGRGVGMDVVKDNIDRLNGTIEIVSTIDRGTLFRIRIPLTLAIIQALKVGVARETFIVPLSAVDETLRIHHNEISIIEGMEICYLRETTLPLIRLTEIFKMQAARPDNQEFFVVVVNTGSRQVGLIVDQLQGRQEVVIKPLEDYLQVKSGFSGATILGDGSIALILDIADLVYLAIALHTRKMRAVSA